MASQKTKDLKNGTGEKWKTKNTYYTPLYQTCYIRDCNRMKSKIILFETE